MNQILNLLYFALKMLDVQVEAWGVEKNKPVK